MNVFNDIFQPKEQMQPTLYLSSVCKAWVAVLWNGQLGQLTCCIRGDQQHQPYQEQAQGL
jgi:hypothetical protein